MSENPRSRAASGELPTGGSGADEGIQDEESWRPVYGRSDSSISTYRYLRLAIVAVILALVASLVLERSHASCWNGSISSYYYTPVHSMFVSALGVIGVALFAIRGATLAEEVLLNMAGFLAPVVAFVPTGWSSTDCPSNLTQASKTTVDSLLSGNRFFAKFSTHNLIAFIVGALIAVGLASLVIAIKRKRRTTAGGPKERYSLPKDLVVPAMGSVVVVGAGYIWHNVWPANFNTHAHSYAAIGMFIVVGIVMLSTAERDESKVYRRLYFACPSVMAAGGIAVFAVGALVTWHHEVLVLEIIELTVFVVFWFLQTSQLWDTLSASTRPGSEIPLRTLSRRVMAGLPSRR